MGVVFDQTEKVLFEVIWKDGSFTSCTTERRELNALLRKKKEEADQLKNNGAKCQRENLELKNDGARLQTENDELKNVVACKKKENDRLVKRLTELESALTSVRGENDKLKKEEAMAKEEIDHFTEVMDWKKADLVNELEILKIEKKKNVKLREAKNKSLRETQGKLRQQDVDLKSLNAEVKKLKDDLFAAKFAAVDCITVSEKKFKEEVAKHAMTIEALVGKNIKTAMRRIDRKDLVINFDQPKGSGVCADVYSADLKIKVALKKIKNRLVEVREFTLSDVEKECQKIGRLNHKHVIKCFGIVFDSSKDFLGILMELGKKSLDDVVRLKKGQKSIKRLNELGEEFLGIAVEKKSMIFSTKAALMTQLAEGMVYLHENRIVHKDLNLKNVLIGFDGKIRIIDFGISKDMIDLKSRILSSRICGTPFFVPPEVLNGGKNVEISKACDVFSFGVVCYCLYHEITLVPDLQVLFYEGKSIVTDQNDISKLLSKIEWKPKAPTNFDRSQVSQEEEIFLTLIDACLQVPPQKRPTFKEIVVVLKKIAN